MKKTVGTTKFSRSWTRNDVAKRALGGREIEKIRTTEIKYATHELYGLFIGTNWEQKRITMI